MEHPVVAGRDLAQVGRSGDIERSFNALWDPFDDIHLESDSRTVLFIIDEADRLKTSGL
jgi:hypothetical protein